MAVVGVFTVAIGALYGGDDWCFCCCGFGNGFVVGIWLDLVGFVLICVLGRGDVVVVAMVVGWCPLLWFLVGSHYLGFCFATFVQRLSFVLIYYIILICWKGIKLIKYVTNLKCMVKMI